MPPFAIPDFPLAAALFALALAGRNLCNLGFVERPIVLGFFWGLCTGDYSLSLPLAVFFELFWLDLFAIGSYLPPMAAFPYLMLMAFARTMDWSTPGHLAFPLALSLPLAYVQPHIEGYLRILQTGAYMRLMGRARRPAPLGRLPGSLMAAAVLRQFCVGLAAFVLVQGVAVVGLALPFSWTKTVLNADWSLLYGIASLGALMALRINRAYIIFTICILSVALIKLL